MNNPLYCYLYAEQVSGYFGFPVGGDRFSMVVGLLNCSALGEMPEIYRYEADRLKPFLGSLQEVIRTMIAQRDETSLHYFKYPPTIDFEGQIFSIAVQHSKERLLLFIFKLENFIRKIIAAQGELTVELSRLTPPRVLTQIGK